MSVKIRLRCVGRKKKRMYRIVVTDSRSPRDGRFIEMLGHYNPLVHPAEIKVNNEKCIMWLNRGAEPSETVLSLFKKIGLMKRWRAIRADSNSNQETAKTTP